MSKQNTCAICGTAPESPDTPGACVPCGKKRREAKRRERLDLPLVMKQKGAPPRFREACAADWGMDIASLRHQSLFIYGPAGTGKTHLLWTLFGEAIYAGHSPMYCSFSWLLAQIRNTYHPSSELTELDLIRKYSEAPMLFIDDLGVEKTSEWTEQITHMIFNERYEHAPERQTVITSNLSLTQLHDQGGERLSSRLCEMCAPFLMNGPDLRVENNG